MKRITKLLCLFVFIFTASFAQSPKIERHLNVDEDKIALDEYDPVSYFKLTAPIKGEETNQVKYEGAIYFFATEAHKQTFLKSPGAYLPQYGGWCAYAMGDKGEKVEVDPETFKIVDGKLYLFYNRFFNNTRDKWDEKETVLKVAANQNWMRIISQ